LGGIPAPHRVVEALPGPVSRVDDTRSTFLQSANIYKNNNILMLPQYTRQLEPKECIIKSRHGQQKTKRRLESEVIVALVGL
jgi:hypothetical protein